MHDSSMSEECSICNDTDVELSNCVVCEALLCKECSDFCWRCGQTVCPDCRDDDDGTCGHCSDSPQTKETRR